MTDAPETVTVHRDIPFQEVDGETLALDLYESTATSGPKPIAVLIRGGAFTVGDKGEFARQAIDLAADGYLVIEPQYRLAPAHTFPAALVDVKAAIEWARSEAVGYGGDPERVVGVGHSAGANLVVLAAATADDPAFEPELYPGTSSALSAVVGYAGVYDFQAFENHDAHAGYLGGTPEELPEAYELASPVTQVDVGMPPTLLCHGTEDETVPIEQSELLAEVLSAVADVTFETVSGGHTFPFDGARYDDVYDLTVQFLNANAGAVSEGAGSDLDDPGDLPGSALDEPVDRPGPGNEFDDRTDREF